MRFNFHKQNVREGSEYEVSKHIKGCGGNFKIMPICKMNSDDSKRRRSMESKLITYLWKAILIKYFINPIPNEDIVWTNRGGF